MERDPQHDSDLRDSNQRESTQPVDAMRELARLWVQSQPAVSAYLSANVFDMHHVEDLVQEVAQVVAEKFAEYDRKGSFTAWALGIARNRLLKYYRSRARDRVVLSDAALSQLSEALARVEHEAEDRRVALKRCLEGITGRRREVLEMRYSENSRVTDIATHFSMSPDGISVMLHKVRKVLLTCIQQQLAAQEGA